MSDTPIALLAALQEALVPLRTLAKEAPAAAKAVTALHRRLAKRPGWTLALSSRGLVVDGQRLKADDFQTIALESDVTTTLVKAGLRYLRFEKGVRVEELGLFLESFARGFEGLRPAAAVNEQLAAAGVRSIRVDDTDAPAPAAAPDGRLPLDRARTAVEEIATAMAEGPSRLRDGLRRAADAILSSFDDARELRAILDRAPEREVPPSVFRAEAALAEGPWAAARLLQSEGDRLMRELADLAPERGAELMQAVAGLLADRQAAARAAGAEALLALRGIWEARPFEPHREKAEEAVRAALEAEPEPDVHARLLDVAGFVAETRLARREIEAAGPMLDVIRRHRDESSPTLPHRADGARRALERLAAVGALQAVLPRLRSGDPAALRLLETFGDAAAAFLVAAARTADPATPRALLADALRRGGPSVPALLADEILRATVPVDALRLLELLDDPPALGRALGHPTTPVRRRAAQLLADRGAGEALLPALRDERDPSLRIALVDHLGRLRTREAADPLIAIATARQEADDLRGAACLALGRIGDPAALEPLLDLARRSSRGLGGLFRTTSTTLRVSALRALGLFDAHPEAREALNAAADEDDPIVAEAAREGLGARLQKAFERPKDDAPKKPTVKLAGSIQDIPIDQVCQLIGGAEKSGLLQLDFDGTPGRLWFEGGFVVAAEYEGRLDQEAVNGFVGRKSGTFMFHPGEAAPAHRMRMPVHNVLLEACRVADEEQKVP